MPYKVNPTTGQLDYYEVAGGGGGGGATNLSFIPSSTIGTVTSDSGTDANIPLANSTNSGLFSPQEKAKLAISLIQVGVDYRGAYNNGDGTYTLGSVVLFNGFLYEKISNPNNPGYPPTGADWELFDPLIGSPSFDLWIRNILDNKVNTEAGKGLSTEDYTTAEQTKLAGIEDGAEVNVNADWNAVSGDALILNKPTELPTSFVRHTVKYGVALTKGQAAYVSSSDGTNMIVTKADYSVESTSSKTMGLIGETGTLNHQGFIVTEGLLSGLNTTAAQLGDPVWLGDDGNLLYGLLNKPVAPNHMVFLGIVTRVNANNGEIFVKVQNGYELDELHNILISSPVSGQILRLDTDSLWKNWTPNYTTGSGTTNYISKWSGSLSLGNSLLFDTGTSIGLGVTTPISLLHLSSVNKTISPTLYTSDFLTISAEETAPGFNIIAAGSSSGHRGVYKATRSRGTLDVPTAVISGDNTFSLVGAGHDGTTNLTTAGISFFVDGAVSTNTVPQAISFATGTGSSRIERMRISSSGNVGIGTTNPTAALSVRSTAVPSAGENLAIFTVSDSSGTLGIQNAANADGVFIPSLVANQAAGVNQIALNLTGYINPADDTGVTPIMTFRSALNSFTGATTRPLFDFRNWSTSMMTIAASGNIGVGIATPTAKLHVNNTTASNSLLIEDEANPDSSPFVITNTGNTGIGTTTPITKLHVVQNANAAVLQGTDHVYQEFYPQGAAAGRFGFIGYSQAGSGIFRFYNGPLGTDMDFVTDNQIRLVIKKTGEIIVNTINSATTDTDKFLVSEAGEIKFRTGAQMLSDIGAQGSITLTTTGTSGAATLVGNTLNIPQYTGGSGGSQDLASVLAIGNSASTDIDMGGYDLLDVESISTATTSMKVLTMINTSLIFYANNC